MKFVLFTVVLIFTALAGASGSRVGNGGHGVICKDSAGRQLPPELLDLYEASSFYGRVPQMILVSSLDEAIQLYRQQLQFALPSDHPLFRLFDHVEHLRASLVLRDQPLNPTDDLDLENFIDVGRNCHIVQIAVRSEPPFEGNLEVSREFWAGSTYQVQALFLLHEAFHSWFWSPAEKVETAKALRQLIGLLYTSSMIADKRDQALARSLINTKRPLPPEELRPVR